jgi:hypothetical protein
MVPRSHHSSNVLSRWLIVAVALLVAAIAAVAFLPREQDVPVAAATPAPAAPQAPERPEQSSGKVPSIPPT